MTDEALGQRRTEAAEDLSEAVGRLADRVGLPPPTLPPLPVEREAVRFAETIETFLSDVESRVRSKHRPTGKAT